MSLALFYILAGLILAAALMVVSLRNVFHSALFLVLAFFLVAGVYLMLDAEFLAAVQVLIYVGAVTILILFAIMLTHKLQSGSTRQANEQVIPAAIISLLFLALAITTFVRTFKSSDGHLRSAGAWTASLDLSDLPPGQFKWNWTINIEDKSGSSYVAAGVFSVSEQENATKIINSKKNRENSGYILSARADYSTTDRIFSQNQTVYMKVWSDKLDKTSVGKAVWSIFDGDGKGQAINLVNSNTEMIGRLLMSRYVLPFEVVSVLLLAALVGAIVIARKDE